MKTLTIHALDPAVEKRIRDRARKENKSLNQTMKELLAASVGRPVSGGSSDHRRDFEEFAGIWSVRDEEEFAETTDAFDRIDEQDWT
jgi:plasmid stability protein